MIRPYALAAGKNMATAAEGAQMWPGGSVGGGTRPPDRPTPRTRVWTLPYLFESVSGSGWSVLSPVPPGRKRIKKPANRMTIATATSH